MDYLILLILSLVSITIILIICAIIFPSKDNGHSENKEEDEE